MSEYCCMYQVKILKGDCFKQEIRYYKKKKDLNDFDLCDVPNFHEDQQGTFLRKDAMFMGAIDVDFSKQEMLYHSIKPNNGIVYFPFESQAPVVIRPSFAKKKSKPSKGQHIPLRASVIEKDRCTYCGVVLNNIQRSPNFKTVDHVYPTSKLGINMPANKVACCSSCNKFKSDYLIEEFLIRINDLLADYPKEINHRIPSQTTLTIILCNVKDFINTHSVELTRDGKYFYKEKELIEQI